MAESESKQAYEFSVQETLKDLSQNVKHIDPKLEQETAIRVLSEDRMRLQLQSIISQKLFLKFAMCLHFVSANLSCKICFKAFKCLLSRGKV